MPIIEIKGDLLASDCDTIAHGCNCFNNMGAGIAYQIKVKYPSAWKADFFTTKIGDRNKLGTFTKAQCKDKLIYNLYAQYKYGHSEVYLEYDKLEQALEAMKQDLIADNKYETTKIGFPKLGCGLARGDWNVVKKIIEKIFQDKDIFIYSL